MMLKRKPRSALRGSAKRYPVASFFVLAYAITWLAWLPTIIGYGGDLGQIPMMIVQFGSDVAILAVATGGRLGSAAVPGRDHTDTPGERGGLYA